MTIARQAGAAAFFLLCAGWTVAPNASALAESPLTQCIQEIAAREAFHGTVAVARLGEEPAVGAFNQAAVPGDTLTATTRFNIGSMGKMFTAVAIGQLKDRGLLAFDDSVRKHLPELPAIYDAVTFHHLLTHTGGTGNYFSPSNRAVLNAAKTASDLLPIATLDTLLFEPGSEWRYSNSGYALMGAVVERITGDRYADYIETNIFAPAGMTQTGLEADDNTATAYTRFRPGEPPNTRPSPDTPLAPSNNSRMRGMPAGGGRSTVTDMARFANALFANQLMTPETTALMLAPKPGAERRSRDGSLARFGYGFYSLADGARVGHGGGGAGVSAELRIWPAEGWVISVLVNLDPPAATSFARAMEQAILSTADDGGCDL